MIIKPRQRGGFSDREKISPFDETIQYKDLNERTRNRLVNFNDNIFNSYSDYHLQEICNQIVSMIFVLKSSDFKSWREVSFEINRGLDQVWSYDLVFTYFEGLFKILGNDYFYNSILVESNFLNRLNTILEIECVGYRLLNGVFVSITNKEEIDCVNEALASKFQVSSISIEKAIKLIYSHDNPDYSNGIKECITAVEAACNIIVGKKSTLSSALKVIQMKIPIHPALSQAFISLFGYTSDQSGIRHNWGEENTSSLAEAQFMLISCSAFINYLSQLYFQI